MGDRSYFLDELDYLREMRQRAAHENWDMARFLAAEGSDPDVERLFEGFAFLTGRLREKLDDEFPEIVQSLLGFWWPHFLRPMPAMSILEFDPVPNAFTDSRLVEAGTQVQSKRVDGSRCLFRTSNEVVMHPLSLEQTRLSEGHGVATLELTLSVWQGARFSFADRGLRLYLHDHIERAADLYRFLVAHAEEIDVSVIDADGQSSHALRLPGSAVRPPSSVFGRSLLPDVSGVGSSYVALQEYFCFPQHRMFVDIDGFDRVARVISDKAPEAVRLSIRFDRPWDFSGMREREPVRLNSVPIVNLFAGMGKPIKLDNTRNEYPLVVESTAGMQCTLYSVDSCEGFRPGLEDAIVFHRFESFSHQSDRARSDYFRLKFAQDPRRGSADPYLAFVKSGGLTEDDELVVSVDLTCCNGNLPLALDPGDINVSTANSPEFARFSNLTRPTRFVPQLLSEHTLWQIVASMAINLHSLLDEETLGTLLRAHDPMGSVEGPAAQQTSRILESLRVERTGSMDRLYKGLPVRGMSSEISLERSVFRSLGQLYVFGEMLDHFLGSFAGINSFHQLTLKDRDSDEVFKWPPKTGNRSTL